MSFYPGVIHSESSIVTSQKYYLQSTDANKKRAVDGLDRLMG